MFDMHIDGYTVSQPWSTPDYMVKKGERWHLLYAVYDNDGAVDHEASIGRAIRFVALLQLRSTT